MQQQALLDHTTHVKLWAAAVGEGLPKPTAAASTLGGREQTTQVGDRVKL